MWAGTEWIVLVLVWWADGGRTLQLIVGSGQRIELEVSVVCYGPNSP